MASCVPLRFGSFELHVDRHVLLRDGRPCQLGGRALDVLRVLLDNRDRIVPRGELIERVWPGLAVEPNNLQVQIWALRRVLGREVIVTVPRRGYRIVEPSGQAGDLQGRQRVRWDERTAAGHAAPVATPSASGETLRPLLRWQARDS